jgi:hypothetical protein
MKLTYQTGVATLIQFIVLGLLNIANGLDSIITTCRHAGGDCVGNVFSSVVFYILAVSWFGIVWIIGYAAQERRSKRLAQLLIAAEGLISLVALFNVKLDLKYHNGFLSLFTSLVDLAMAVWIITLAFRLMRAGTGRVVTKQRARTRRRKSTAK